MTGPAPMLPGLELPAQAVGPQTPIEVEARHHLEHLAGLGLLGREHRLLGQAVLDMAHVVGISTRAGKAAAAALAMRQLAELMDRLPMPVVQEGQTAHEAVVAAIAGDE